MELSGGTLSIVSGAQKRDLGWRDLNIVCIWMLMEDVGIEKLTRGEVALG